ncbi:TolC family protein [Stieleria marina]|uniref:TolC family protein n=1 Tax=Stieleria marina TaxID=1930275 RepID=UPI003AF349D7
MILRQLPSAFTAAWLALCASQTVAEQPPSGLRATAQTTPIEALRASDGLIEEGDSAGLPDAPQSAIAFPVNRQAEVRANSESNPLVSVPVEALDVEPDNDLTTHAAEVPIAVDASDANGPLKLADVIASVYHAYPEVASSKLEYQIANGQLKSAYGWYDTKVKGYTLNEPTGYYENYRHGIGVARQTWWGGYLSAGYRIGRGEFQPWYKERETDKAGELKASWQQALLQGRAIDPQRVEVFQASVSRKAAAPQVQQIIIETSRDAALAYWKWVAEGTVLKAQRELLELAQKRNEQFVVGVRAGKFPEIDLILNQQLLAERQAKVLEVRRKYQAAAFKLSLFLRDEMGKPMMPEDTWLPEEFPVTEVPARPDFESSVMASIERRPEFQLLRLKRQQLQYDYQLACNQTLPQVDLIAEASQDMGADASSKDDKDEFLVILGLQGELPIQRRKARGKIQQTTAKMAQLDQKIRLQTDKVVTDLRTGFASLELYAQVVEQSDLSLRAAFDTLDRYRFAFTKGKVDLLYLNLIETKAYETEIKLIQAQQQWFSALAELQATMGLDPLAQATTVDAMPPSDHPGPGNLPVPEQDDEPAEDASGTNRTSSDAEQNRSAKPQAGETLSGEKQPSERRLNQAAE